MNITVHPGLLRGTIPAIPSKSQAHRVLICSAFADRPTEILCPQINADIEATVRCLEALGADIRRTGTGFTVIPTACLPEQAVLPCGESGSTLRFFLPIAGALGITADFLLEGRLPQRPMEPLWSEMIRQDCRLSRPAPAVIRCQGKLTPGAYEISGSVSSQFITGLLYGFSLMSRDSTLSVTGKMESVPYIHMTLAALRAFGIRVRAEENRFEVTSHRFLSPGQARIEGDWSNGAFWLTAAALGSQIHVTNLDPDSPQGDRAVAGLLDRLEQFCRIDCAQTPDLVPVLAVAAAAKQGACFTNIGRLRLKETDRVATTAAMLNNLGARVDIQADTMTVHPARLTGGTVDASGDHRIAMAAAVAATVCSGPVTICGAESVAKSYPGFWEDYQKSGGKL